MYLRKSWFIIAYVMKTGTGLAIGSTYSGLEPKRVTCSSLCFSVLRNKARNNFVEQFTLCRSIFMGVNVKCDVVKDRITLTTWPHGLEAFCIVGPCICGRCSHSLKWFLLMKSKTSGYWDATITICQGRFLATAWRECRMKLISDINNLVPLSQQHYM